MLLKYHRLNVLLLFRHHGSIAPSIIFRKTDKFNIWCILFANDLLISKNNAYLFKISVSTLEKRKKYLASAVKTSKLSLFLY